MIEELKFRSIIQDTVKEIGADDIDLLISYFTNTLDSTKYMIQRRIYIIDFKNFIQSGYIFKDLGEDIIPISG